jgi:PAS domain S-box-containing protein
MEPRQSLREDFGWLRAEKNWRWPGGGNREGTPDWFREILERAPVGACVVQDGLVQYANPALMGIIGGVSPDPSAGLVPLSEFLHPDHRQKFMARYERFIASASEEQVCRTEFLHRQGHGVSVEVKACRIAAGGPESSILLYVHGTEKAKGLNLWGDERFKSLIENASDIIIVLDEKGTITYEAPSARNIMGYPDGYFIGRNPFDLIHPDDRPAVEEAFRALLASNHFELHSPFRFLKADGTWIYLDAMGKNLRETPGIRGYIVTCRDMSCRVQSEKRLEQNLAMTRSLINAMGNAVLLLDNRGVILAANHMIARYLRKPLDQLIGTDIADSMPPDDLKKWQNRWQRFQQGGEPIRYCDRIGRREFDLSVHPLSDADGQLVQIAIFGYDVTQHKIDEEALRASRREWMTIFQAVGHPTVILDADQRIIQANQAACLALGKKEPEIIGRKCYEVFHRPGLDCPPCKCPMQRLLVTEESETGEMEMEALCGDYIVSCTPVLDAEGNWRRSSISPPTLPNASRRSGGWRGSGPS